MLMSTRNVREEVRRYYRERVKARFGASCLMAWLTGSFAYSGGTRGKSDIDVLVVLDDAFAALEPRERAGQVAGFVNDYLALHLRTGYVPDLQFPGEYVTEAIIKDAVAGRGFHVGEDGALFLPRASVEYYLADPERWFRAWLSQTAFSRFIGGDEAAYQAHKRAAWATILKFVLKNCPLESIEEDDVFGLLRAFGVHADYWDFRASERAWVGEGLRELLDEGMLLAYGGRYVPVRESLATWEGVVAQAVRSGSIRRAAFLFDMPLTREIAAIATTRWEELRAAAGSARCV